MENKKKLFYEFLIKLNEFKFDYSLKRIKKILKILKNPQNNFKVIHITGSNGKGSVAMFLTNILKAHNIKVGTYLSPHIKDVKERILIQGKKIKENIFISNGYKIITLMKKNKINLTYFEFLTVLALLIFKKLKVKIAIIEVGLGGRYDATNLNYKKKLLSIITSISKEHTQLLGNTQLSILKEKEKIIKKEPAVCNIKNTILKKYLKKTNKKIIYPHDFYEIKKIYFKDKMLFIEILNKEGKKIEIYKTRMIEQIQAENILTVLTSIKILRKYFEFSDEKIKKSIEKTFLLGRLSLTNKGYFISVAHNYAAIKFMLSSIDKNFFPKKIIYIFSLLKDKNLNKICKVFFKYKNKLIIIITSINNERAMDVQKIKRFLDKYQIKNFLLQNNKEALDFAYKIKGKDDIIIIGGSFYLLNKYV